MTVRYIAEDGRGFDSKTACKAYEKNKILFKRDDIVASINRMKADELRVRHRDYISFKNMTLETYDLRIGVSWRVMRYYIEERRQYYFEKLNDCIRKHRLLREQLKRINKEIRNGTVW